MAVYFKDAPPAFLSSGFPLFPEWGCGSDSTTCPVKPWREKSVSFHIKNIALSLNFIALDASLMTFAPTGKVVFSFDTV
jgi:hypothetical protein